MTDQTAPLPPLPSRKKLLVGSLAALAVAGLVVVGFVLPAEYGVDPLGTGKALGLNKLSEPGLSIEQIRGNKRVGALTLSDAPPTPTKWDDRWQITLRPYEAIELKYTLAEKAPLDFSWTATGPLHYDMHSHPFDGGDKLTETYSLETREQMHGRYVAQFTGLHGWYWQNRSMNDVTLTVLAAGPITGSTIFEMGVPSERALTPPD